MSIITISREYGSDGRYIAEKVAQTLSYHFVDKKTMEDVLVQYGFVEFEKEYDAAHGFWTRFDARTTEMVKMLNRIIQAVARHGNVVILGRGSFAILSGYADVLNVRIQAPLQIRRARVMTQHNIAEPAEAEAILKEADRVRTTFIESYYGVHWDVASAFDVVIDTGKVAPDLAVTWLADAAKAVQPRPAGEGRTTSALEVDPILASAVSAVLKCQETH